MSKKHSSALKAAQALLATLAVLLQLPAALLLLLYKMGRCYCCWHLTGAADYALLLM
jgi:hypothetical protein